MKPPKMEPTKLGVWGKIRWKLIRYFMQTIGRTSQGVSIGFKYGFNSGTMLDYVYRNKPQGSWVIGKYLDRIYLNAIGWRAIRNRRHLLQDMLRVELDRFRSNNQEIRLLDVAAGPGRYLQELLKENPANFRVLCRDLITDGLNQGKLEAQEAGLNGIHFEVGDAFNPAPTDATLGGQPNIMVVSGLYEQIRDDKIVINSLKEFFKFLPPGGIIVLTTQLQHPNLDFVANVMISYSGERWVLKCRYLRTIEDWVRQAGFEEITSRQEKEGLCAVTRAQKPLEAN